MTSEKEAMRLQYEANPSVEGEASETPKEPERVWPNPFATHNMGEIRGFVVQTLPGMPVPLLTECPSAEEMARLTNDVMRLSIAQLSQVLKVPVGPVSQWLDPGSGSRPTAATVREPQSWTWDNFIGLWSAAAWWEKERERQATEVVE